MTKIMTDGLSVNMLHLGDNYKGITIFKIFIRGGILSDMRSEI